MHKHGDVMKKTCLPTSESRPDMFKDACIPLLPDVPTCNDHHFNKTWALKISFGSI
jgi:hypothetical protein